MSLNDIKTWCKRSVLLQSSGFLTPFIINIGEIMGCDVPRLRHIFLLITELILEYGEHMK